MVFWMELMKAKIKSQHLEFIRYIPIQLCIQFLSCLSALPPDILAAIWYKPVWLTLGTQVSSDILGNLYKATQIPTDHVSRFYLIWMKVLFRINQRWLSKQIGEIVRIEYSP